MAKAKKDLPRRELPKRDMATDSVRTYVESIVSESNQPDYQYIPLNELELNPKNIYNQYDTSESIEVLAEDIVRNGQLHNLVVSAREDGHKIILSGERRYKAFLLNQKRYPDKTSYETVFAQIRKGLGETEEDIIMDAANLQARGGVENEYKRRVAAVRFVERLKEQHGITTKEAIKITAEIAGTTEKTIGANVSIETELVASLKELYNNGLINKEMAVVFSSFPDERQTAFASTLEKLKNHVSQQSPELAKYTVTLSEKIIAQQKEIDEQNTAIKNAKFLIESAMVQAEKAEPGADRDQAQKKQQAILQQIDAMEKARPKAKTDEELIDTLLGNKTPEEKLKEKAQKKLETLTNSVNFLTQEKTKEILKSTDKENFLEDIKMAIGKLRKLEKDLKKE